MNQTEKIAITKHLAVMLKSGISLSEALTNLIDQAKTKSSRQILQAIKFELDNGNELNKALTKYPKVFNEFYRGIIMVGEKTGRLDSSLEYLATELSQEYSLKRKVQGALMYPAIILTATIGLAGFISFYILPRLVDFFKAFESQLPPTTQVLLRVAEFMKSYGILVFTFILISFIIFILLLRLPGFKFFWQGSQLHWPIFGRLIRDQEVTRFCRNMGILIKSGVPIRQSFVIAANSQTNLIFKKAITEIGDNLEKGQGITEILRKGSYNHIFPRLVADMVAVGEKSGRLDESFLYVSQFFGQEVEDRAKNMAGIIEPVVLLAIGLVVAFVALAIISPIYELTGAIGG